MQPRELNGGSFGAYPPLGRAVAVRQIALIQQLPLAFVPLLLREVMAYDWKFPKERGELDRQFGYLAAMAPDARAKALAGFAQLRLSPELERVDWVNSPAQFSEQLTAHLWATHQIDLFRETAVAYVAKLNASAQREPLAMPRLGMVVIGQGVTENQYPLFRKLRPEGVYYRQVRASHGCRTLVDLVGSRAAAHPTPYGHWYIDGDTPEPVTATGVTCVAYDTLTPARAALQNKMQKAFEGGVGSESLRTLLAQLRPEEIGLTDAAGDSVLNHFQVSLLTEGAGTQVFSTTFVQWAAREALRRAEPVTVLARFAPRQRERPMNELLAEARHKPVLDPQGSLVDADMGAYYTWLNQQRLSGADQGSFLVWFENHGEALAIGPKQARGAESKAPIELEHLLAQLT